MRPLEAREHLGQELRRRGVTLTRSAGTWVGPGEAWQAAWEAFCVMAAEPAGEPFERAGTTLRVPDSSTDVDLLLHESATQSDGEREIFVVSLTRQFSFVDATDEYAGMNAVTLTVECDRLPEGRVPRAQRWGYAGPRRPPVDDGSHPEIPNWAGHLDAWREAVAASNSFKTLGALPPRRFLLDQEDI